METKKQFQKVFNFLKKGAQWCAFVWLGLWVFIIFLFAFAIYFAVFNPLCFLALVFIAPRFVARIFNNDSKDGILEFVVKIFWHLNKWYFSWLPWRCRREFLFTFLKPTLSEEVRCFTDAADKEELLKQNVLSRAALKEIWFLGADFHSMLLPYMGRLNIDEFRYMVRENERMLFEYTKAKRYTLSDEMLDFLLGASLTRTMSAFLVPYIKDHGLNLNLVSKYGDYLRGYSGACLQSALDVYNQKEVVKKTGSDLQLWKKYCQTLKEDLCSEAQVMMTRFQCKIYFDCGHFMSVEAIRQIFATERTELWEDIIFHIVEKNAVREGDVSSSVYQLIDADLRLKKIYLRFLSPDKRSFSASNSVF